MDMISPLLKTTKYDCIISNNDAMALGAVEAMQQQGLDPKSVPIVGHRRNRLTAVRLSRTAPSL